MDKREGVTFTEEKTHKNAVECMKLLGLPEKAGLWYNSGKETLAGRLLYDMRGRIPNM